MILLIRVYELETEYPKECIETNGVYSHKITGDSILPLKGPVIEDEEFLQIHKKLDNLLINLDALKYKEIYISHDNIEDFTYETEVLRVFDF